MISTVYVFGAGASFGDTLRFYRGYKGDAATLPPNPPLANQFFRTEHLREKPKEIEAAYAPLIGYIRNHWGISQALGTKPWETLNIEDVFTSLALLNDFSSPDTNEKAISRVRMNSLTRYIRRCISHSTLFRFGHYTRSVVQQLKPEDSILSFNYDLLVDQELLDSQGPLQYQNFSAKLLRTDIRKVGKSYEKKRRLLTPLVSAGSSARPTVLHDGLYLKLHGSLNWFICPHPTCARSEKLIVIPDVGQCLLAHGIGITFQCSHCCSELTPFLVPPFLQKPVITDRVLRSIWGNALALLANADRIVVIGLSFQPSDFYAAWLFRRALEENRAAKVWIVNPDSKTKDFKARMLRIFVNGYDDSVDRFDRIDRLI